MSLIATGFNLIAAARSAWARRADARAIEALPFDVHKDIGWQRAADPAPSASDRLPRAKVRTISGRPRLA